MRVVATRIAVIFTVLASLIGIHPMTASAQNLAVSAFECSALALHIAPEADLQAAAQAERLFRIGREAALEELTLARQQANPQSEPDWGAPFGDRAAFLSNQSNDFLIGLLFQRAVSNVADYLGGQPPEIAAKAEFFRRNCALIGGDLTLEVAPEVSPPGVIDDDLQIDAPSAFLYVESDDGDVPAVRYDATIDWFLDRDPESQPIIAADISVPERGLEIALRIGQSPEPEFELDIVVQATVERGAATGETVEIAGLTVKSSEAAIGVALNILISQPNLLLVSIAIENETGNLTRLRISPWFDIALVHENGERAILAFSKGTEGSEVFAQAFAAW